MQGFRHPLKESAQATPTGFTPHRDLCNISFMPESSKSSAVRTFIAIVLIGAFCLVTTLYHRAAAQSPTDTPALKGLAPVAVLANSPAGQAALAANYTQTGGIQNGTVKQPTLLPFAAQQQQALADAFITSGDLAQLADGLGTALSSAYLAHAQYTDRKHYTNISQRVADLIAYANSTTGQNSNAAKFFFANATTDGKTPVPATTAAILKDINGHTDPFGVAYHLPAGSPNADAYGDSRPFQTEHHYISFTGQDYFHDDSGNDVYNRGPVMNLINSPSYPSGHTTYGYTGAILLAVLIPERYQQMVTRGAEYGNDRIIMGAHYTMDVLGGRTLALYDLAHLLANDPAYMNQHFTHAYNGNVPSIPDFRAALLAARADIVTALQTTCGKPVATCATTDTSRFANPTADEAFYNATQTYDLGVVYPQNANKIEDISKIAPEAGYLLTVAYPKLTLEQADKILTETEGPGGGFLDNGSAFGVYSRLNLYAAASKAAQLTAY